MTGRSEGGEVLQGEGEAQVAAESAGGRVAVVDIGSNSIRLVVFESLGRAPAPVFNERVLCGLARGIERSGALNQDGVELALVNLTRFARLAEAMGVTRLDFLATAAVRQATNGPAFVREVERRCGCKVTVISGEEEARLAALGVVSGMSGATGLVADLGGGSLELVQLRDGRIKDAASLPLGALRLQEVGDGSVGAVLDEVDRQLSTLSWLSDSAGETFYPVGGAWRALAKIHMSQARYPLHVIHGYTLSRWRAYDHARLVARLGPRSLKGIKGIAKRRLETLPNASIVFQRVLRHARCDRVVFSSFGLREGHLFDLLSPEVQALDPLLVAASDLARVEGRFGDLGLDLLAFTDPLFPLEAAGNKTHRLRQAACHLADIAWREHPDYRAVQAMYRILRLPLLALEHSERAFLAYAAFVRYGGKASHTDAKEVLSLLNKEERSRAEILGQALRLAIAVSGGTRLILRGVSLDCPDEASIALHLPKDRLMGPGDVLQKRLNALAKAMGRKARET